MSDSNDAVGRNVTQSRRRFLALGGATAATALAGCSGLLGSGDGGSDGGTGAGAGQISLADFRGSGPLVAARDAPGGTSIEELPDLSGELTLYLGGGEGGLYLDLINLFEQLYPDFSANHRLEASSDLANTIIEENEAGASPADVFMSIDAGSLGAVANAGATASLPEEALSTVPDAYQDSEGRWVGIAGRARAIPYNTNQISESDIPSSVQEFPEAAALENSMGWAPSYGAVQSFVTAMRLIRGDDETRAWLQAMQDHGIETPRTATPGPAGYTSSTACVVSVIGRSSRMNATKRSRPSNVRSGRRWTKSGSSSPASRSYSPASSAS